MPYDLSFFQLPCGARAARLAMRGIISGGDAEELVHKTGPGGDMFLVPTLALTAEMKAISSAARGLFAGRADRPQHESWTAVVVTNPIARVAIRFIMRVQRTNKADLFGTEAEAIRWLDKRAREQAPGRAGQP
jgi:hypothetical protein